MGKELVEDCLEFVEDFFDFVEDFFDFVEDFKDFVEDFKDFVEEFVEEDRFDFVEEEDRFELCFITSRGNIFYIYTFHIQGITNYIRIC